MRPHRRQALVLVLMMGIVALLAQVAGVGSKQGRTPPAPRAAAIAVVPDGSVPDIMSTKLKETSTTAAEGDVVRMSATATVRATKLRSSSVAQVVCGIRYSRAGDPSWSLGTPTETVQLAERGASKTVSISRSFQAPARDTYRMSMACHVAAPATGATVTATGTMRSALGLPDGAATPIA